MPFGVSGLPQRLVTLSTTSTFAIKGYDEDDSYMKKFYEVCRKLEDKIINAVVEQSEAIFGSHMSRRTVSNVQLQCKNVPDREPKFRVKVDTDIEGNIKPNVLMR